MKAFFYLIGIFLAFNSFFISFSSIALAQNDEDRRFLLIYFKEEDLDVASPTRGKKSVTQTAENVTVITSDDIKNLNAHTVAEVLNTVTGVQVFLTGGPGSSAEADIQDSESRHVSVFMDGVPLNDLSDNVTDIGILPVQNIERIEIIKGPASSAWGSALGGIVNIITKSGSGDSAGGTVSATYGERSTEDYRIETLGKQSQFGYYVTAGRLQTDGFRLNNDFSGNNAYTKLNYDLTRDTSFVFTMNYSNLSRGTAQLPSYDLKINNNFETWFSTLSIKSMIGKDTEFDLSVWSSHQDFVFYNDQLSTGLELSQDRYVDTGYGTSVKLIWKQQHHNVVLGSDLDSRKLESNTIAGGEQGIKKWASFVNDTISIDKLTITPGIRYDKTDTNGDFTSPSLGMTYKITDNTLLRAYTARGFSIPPLTYTYGDGLLYVANPNLKMERVWSYQIGMESTALPYLWLKLSLFRHDIKDAIVTEPFSSSTYISVNVGQERRQGMEIEMKTVPVYHTSLSAGAAFMTATDQLTGQAIPNDAQRTYDIGLQYDDQQSLKARLQGHYVYWNASPSYQGRYDSFIVDLHVIKNLYLNKKQSVEALFDIHNIFDGDQYLINVYNNPGRWLEAGIRYKF
ncbi:MAG TPA: TonB-dependent receptor [Nitrospirota bacterium]|nr:TonB-dependent receptor [Nitrospirota bacterium]